MQFTIIQWTNMSEELRIHIFTPIIRNKLWTVVNLVKIQPVGISGKLSWTTTIDNFHVQIQSEF